MCPGSHVSASFNLADSRTLSAGRIRKAGIDKGNRQILRACISMSLLQIVVSFALFWWLLAPLHMVDRISLQPEAPSGDSGRTFYANFELLEPTVYGLLSCTPLTPRSGRLAPLLASCHLPESFRWCWSDIRHASSKSLGNSTICPRLG
jgi:hypothetical protein